MEKPTFRKLIPELWFGILVVLLCTPVKGLAEPPASPLNIPARLPTAGSPVKPVPPKIIWQDNRLSLETVDWDLRQVFQAVSEKTGVEIRLEKEVSGKISYRGEKEPLEKVVDGILRGVGEKNYVMARAGTELKEIYILPRPEGGKAPVPRAKVKGKLKNGKEIEYFPGEIVVGIHLFKDYHAGLLVLIKALEERHGLVLLSRAKMINQEALKFRILGGRDVLEVIREIQATMEADWRVTYVTPNGISPASIEVPEEDFHVWQGTARGRFEKMQLNPHMRYGKIYEEPGYSREEYFEGEFSISIKDVDLPRITYEDILALTNEEKGILFGYSSDSTGLTKDVSYIIYIPGLDSDEAFAEKLKELRTKIKVMRVSEYTDAGPRKRCDLDSIPDDEIFVSLGSLDRAQWNLTRSRAEHAWDATWDAGGGERVRVAVIDTGIYYDPAVTLGHDLAGCISGDGYNYITNDPDPYDELGHGTHVSGIFGALTDNGMGVAGVAGNGLLGDQAEILPIKFNIEDAGTLEQSLNWAMAKNSRIVNLSNRWYAVKDAKDELQAATSRGILLIGAAGNDNAPFFSNLAPELAQAIDEGSIKILVVGATDQSEQRVVIRPEPGYASNWGQGINVSAPGRNIWSTYSGDPQRMVEEHQQFEWIGENLYATNSGTSQAVPHVTGVAALLFSIVEENHPYWLSSQKRDEVYRIIKDTADTDGVAAEMKSRINAYSAVRAALGFAKDTQPPSTPTFFQYHPDSPWVHLTWVGSTDPAPDNDFGEYMIYRRETGGPGCTYPEEARGVPGTLYRPLVRVFLGTNNNDYAPSFSSYANTGNVTCNLLDTSVELGKTYFYRVAAIDKTGNPSFASSEITVDLSIPSAPQNLRGFVEQDPMAIKLEWDPPTLHSGLVTMYAIYRKTGKEDPFSSVPLVEVPYTSTSFLDNSGLTPGSTYYYAVKAVTAFNESPFSNVIPVMATNQSLEQKLVGAVPGNPIWIGPGIHKLSGPITIPDGVQLQSSLGPGFSVIDCEQDSTQITLGNNSILRGFTVQNTSNAYSVYLFLSELAGVYNNIITCNKFGLYCGTSDQALILNNTIAANEIDGMTNIQWGGIEDMGPDGNGFVPYIKNNIFYMNGRYGLDAEVWYNGDLLNVTNNCSFLNGQQDFRSNIGHNFSAVGNNIISDPKFIDPPSQPGDIFADYHLRGGTFPEFPCVDGGDSDSAFIPLCVPQGVKDGWSYNKDSYLGASAGRGTPWADMGAYGGPFNYPDTGTLIIAKTTEIPAVAGATATVGPGGTFTLDALTVQANALLQDTSLTLSQPVLNTGALSALEIEPAGTTFTISATLTVQYGDSEIYEGNESLMRLFTLNEQDMTWERIGGTQTVNSVDNTVTASITHLSIYAALPDLSPPDEVTNFTAVKVANQPYVDLLWTASASADLVSYKLYISDGVNPEALYRTYTPEGYSERVTGLVNGMTYTFRLTGTDDVGNESAGATATLLFDDVPPATPIISSPASDFWTTQTTVVVTGTADPDTRITLSVSPSSYYSAEQFTDSQGGFRFEGVRLPAGYPHPDIWVTAWDGAGNNSFARIFVTLDRTPPNLRVPAPIAVETEGPSGVPAASAQLDPYFAAVSFTDNLDPAPVMIDDVPAFFPLGLTNNPNNPGDRADLGKRERRREEGLSNPPEKDQQGGGVLRKGT